MANDLTYPNESGNGATTISNISDADGSDRVITTTMNPVPALTDNNSDTIAAKTSIQDGSGNSAITTAKALSVTSSEQSITLNPTTFKNTI